MKRTVTTYGYVTIYENGKTRFEHDLVWEQYNGPIHSGCEIHHLDGDRANNDISNLDMMTGESHRRLHKKFMFIGGVWFKECLTCHKLILADELDKHAPTHHKEMRIRYSRAFEKHKSIFFMPVDGTYVDVLLTYNGQSGKVYINSRFQYPSKYNTTIFTKALFSWTIEPYIGLNVSLMFNDKKMFNIITTWRKRKSNAKEQLSV